MRNFSIYTNNADKLLKAHYKKRLRLKYRIGVGFILFILACILFFSYRNREYEHYQRVKTLVEDNSYSVVESFQKGIVRYSGGELTFFDKRGKKKWDEADSMNNPSIKVNENYIMLYSKNGTELHIYDEDGKRYQIRTAYTITDQEISAQGVVAVSLSAGKTNYIELYSLKNEKLVSIKTSIKETGYPLDIALSPNGKTLCASYFFVNGVESQNRITFYDFSEKGERTENILAGFDFNETVVPRVTFLDDVTACAFGDDRICVYSLTNAPKLKKEIDIDSNIRSIAYDQDHFAIVREHYDYEKEKKGNYGIEIFSKNGNLVGRTNLKTDYNEIHLYDGRLILSSAYHSRVIAMNGQTIFERDFDKYLSRMIPGRGENYYFMKYGDRLDLMKLR